jgi:hypothetical protein
VAHGRQPGGSALVGPTVRGVIGALATPPVVLRIASRRHGAPSQQTFLPAFWILVPGAAGLAGLTEAVGTAAGLEDFATALTAVMSIALGVLIGTALYRVVHHGAEEISQFHIEMPAVLAEEDAPLWARLVPGTPRSFWGRRGRGGGGAPEHSVDALERSGPSSQAVET